MILKRSRDTHHETVSCVFVTASDSDSDTDTDTDIDTTELEMEESERVCSHGYPCKN